MRDLAQRQVHPLGRRWIRRAAHLIFVTNDYDRPRLRGGLAARVAALFGVAGPDFDLLADESDGLTRGIDLQQRVNLLALLPVDLERAELGELRHELLVVDRLQRVLESQLCQQDAQEILLGDGRVARHRVVRRAGKSVELTAREYALLEYLAHREGQVVTRTDIREQLYGHDDPTTSNVVDVYIGYLRNKIDRDHPVKLIHTRRGLGYVLTAAS